jgi:hypothetical protein
MRDIHVGQRIKTVTVLYIAFGTKNVNSIQQEAFSLILKHFSLLDLDSDLDSRKALDLGEKEHTSKRIPVFRIRRIHMFLGLPYPDPDPLVRGRDPDLGPSIIKQK